MPRIPLFDPAVMSEEQKKIYEDIVKGPRGRLVGPLRAVLHNAELADKWQQFGAILRYNTSVPKKLSELAILVTARRWNSPVEWYIHTGEAVKAGLSMPVIEAIGIGKVPDFETREEALVYEFVRSMQENGDVPDSLYGKLQELLGVSGVMELSSISGYYSLVAMTLNVHAVPLPEGAPAKPLPDIPGAGGLTILPAIDIED